MAQKSVNVANSVSVYQANLQSMQQQLVSDQAKPASAFGTVIAAGVADLTIWSDLAKAWKSDGVAGVFNWAGDLLTDGMWNAAVASPQFGQVLNAVDGLFAGFSHALTAGLTTRLRTLVYGDLATQNHQGVWFNVGVALGTVANIILMANPCAMARSPSMGSTDSRQLAAPGTRSRTSPARTLCRQGWTSSACWVTCSVCCGRVSRRTPLRTPTGSKNIEDFKPGDLILSRPENDPDGPVEVKVVEERFVWTGRILELYVGGKVIRTTAEHPFWVKSRGWVAAGELEVGAEVSSDDRQWLRLDRLVDTGKYETVYNVRVQDYHTYFVGWEEWGSLGLAHNTYTGHLNSNDAKGNFGLYEITVNDPSRSLFKIGKADLGRITQSSGLPTRLHQQVRGLEKVYGKGNVIGRVVEDLGVVTTLEAKAAETARRQRWFDAMGFVPRGNQSSFIPRI